MNLYSFIVNNTLNGNDIQGLSGAFQFEELTVDNVMDRANGGSAFVDSADGFEVRYDPEGYHPTIPSSLTDPSLCPSEGYEIKVVQAVDDGDPTIDTSKPHRDRNAASPTGINPPSQVESGAPAGDRQIYDYLDAPGAAAFMNALGGRTINFEVCAYCECKKTKNRTLLGCVTFSWHSKTKKLTVPGGVQGNKGKTRVPANPSAGELMSDAQRLWKKKAGSALP